VPGTGPYELFRIAGALVGSRCARTSGSTRVRGGPGPGRRRPGGQLERLAVLAGAPVAAAGHPGRAGGRSRLRHRVRQPGGGQDELVFDGASLVVDADGTLLAAGRQFETDLVLCDITTDTDSSIDTATCRVVEWSAESRAATSRIAPVLPEPLEPHAEVYAALVLGTRDYLAKNGFSDAVMGLSAASIPPSWPPSPPMRSGPSTSTPSPCPRAIPARARAATPRWWPSGSASTWRWWPWSRPRRGLGDAVPAPGRRPEGLTDENLQSRLRGLLLMAVSNERGGSCSPPATRARWRRLLHPLRGSAGGFAVIKDVPKTLVYELCAYRNARAMAAGSLLPSPTPS